MYRFIVEAIFLTQGAIWAETAFKYAEPRQGFGINGKKCYWVMKMIKIPLGDILSWGKPLKEPVIS